MTALACESRSSFYFEINNIMYKLVKQQAILRHTSYSVIFYLRQNKLITKFCQEIRNAEKTIDSPKFNLNAFDWNKSIYGYEFWSNHKHCYKIWKRKYSQIEN